MISEEGLIRNKSSCSAAYALGVATHASSYMNGQGDPYTRVTSPKGLKPSFFSYFFKGLRVRDWFQSLLQALTSNFPSKMPDLDAYVSSYCTFRRFCRVWKVAKPFLKIWEPFSLVSDLGEALEGS